MKMRLQQIVKRLQKLHPKEIDLSLNRILNLCKKLDNPQNKIKAISVVGTNGKYSTIQAMYAILKEAKINCNIYTSPHIKKINERFVFNNRELNDDELSYLLEQVENIDLEDLEKINLIEKAVHDQNYNEEDLFNLYTRYQFNFNQLLSAKDTYKTLDKSSQKALIYQKMLLTDGANEKIYLARLLKNLFEADNLENAFSNELSNILLLKPSCCHFTKASLPIKLPLFK